MLVYAKIFQNVRSYMANISKQNHKDIDEKNIHAGHRERLFNQAYEVGLDKMTKIQTLEAILCFVFPRGDVNPLAHRLLNHFGSLSAVLEADVHDVARIKGMGEISAKKLHLLTQINLVYALDKMKVCPKFDSYSDIYDYVENLLRFKTVEELYFIAIGADKTCLNTKLFATGSINMVGISMNDLMLYLASTRAHALIIAHNHPNGSCKPSPQDEKAFEKLKTMTQMANCQLIDSLVVGSDGLYSMENKSVARVYLKESAPLAELEENEQDLSWFCEIKEQLKKFQADASKGV